ncbi:hypothetical protein BDV06DRAFT_86230 [Aspergillus oleicola]
MDLLPECAAACLAKALPSSSCSVTDISCMCVDQPLIAQTLACGLQTCTPKEGLLSQRALYTACDWPVTHDRNVFPIILIVGQVLSFLSVALRVAVRLVTSNIGLDDTMILLSLGAVIAVLGLGLENQRLGLGTDLWFLPFADITKFLHYYFAIETLYITSITLTKLSMLLLYLRLFPEKRIRWAIYITLALTTAWGVSLLLANIFSCTPVSYIWHSWDGEHEGSCISHEKVMWTHAITNIVFDVIIIALPMPTLLNLNMSLKKKIGVVIMFAVGLVVTAVSILRCVTLLKFNINDNATKKIVPVSIYSVVELDLSIICACMPGIRAFITYVHTAIFGKPQTTTNYSYYSTQFSARRANPSAMADNLIPPPEAVRSGTFKTADPDTRIKMGSFIELQETESRSQSRISRAYTVTPIGVAIGSQSQRTSKTWFDNS